MPQHNHADSRVEAVQIARMMLAGELSYIEGARLLRANRTILDLDEHDPDAICFLIIDSETDDVPSPTSQKLWSAEAIEKHKDNWDQAELWARQTGLSACNSLILRFNKKSDTSE